MLKIYGIAVSNYYNIVKQSLLEKELEFEEVTVRPNQEADYLSKSPMGKVPCIETDNGFLAESTVIMDYLEEVHPNPALYPAEAWSRAKARELIRVTEHYIELNARRHLGSVMFGAPRSQDAFDEVRPEVEKGLRAFKQLVQFDPFVTGSRFGYADIFVFYAFNLAKVLMQAVYDWDIVAEVPGLAEQLAAVGERAATQQCVARQQEMMAAMRASND